MQLVSVVSTAGETHRALAEICANASHRLRGAKPDLVLAFITAKHLQNPGDAAAIGNALREQFPTALFLATTGVGAIGDGREVEGRPAISLLAAVLPGVELRAFHLTNADIPLYSGPEAAQRWRNLLQPLDAGGEPTSDALPPGEDPTVLLLPDPFCTGLGEVIAGLDAAWPGGHVVGGVASGFREPGQHRLLLDDEIHDGGVLGVMMYGDVRVDIRVAQGCRPVGQPLFVTQAQGRRLIALDGRPAADVLQEVFETSDDGERERMGQSLFLGIGLVDRETYGRGDFLVRHILGAEPDTGALIVQGELQEGQVVQFHVRDGQSSEEDLRAHLASVPPGAAGAILFACLGRGQALYGVPDHDAQVIRDAYGDVPLAGLFCNGEVGPVNGETFLHGYTASLCFLRPRESR